MNTIVIFKYNIKLFDEKYIMFINYDIFKIKNLYIFNQK